MNFFPLIDLVAVNVFLWLSPSDPGVSPAPRIGFKTSNYTHPDDHTIRTTDTPGFKPFTLNI